MKFVILKNMANNSSDSLEDLFYFESDHLALKGNKDYCDVLKTIVILTAQQKRAIEDYSEVAQIRKKALEDPAGALEQIQSGKGLNVPARIELPKIPNINFQKYDVKVPEEELKLIYSDSVKKKSEDEGLNITQTNGNSRVWTPEEQKRLEELLVIFPPEPVEMRRFHKIARALGNRTVQQVCSRVQKYFLKLYKAGLPIPGKIPKSVEKYKRSMLHKHQRHNHYLWKPTTFFPNLCVPVVMDDLENVPGPTSNSSAPSLAASTSTNYLLPGEYHTSSSNETVKSEAELQLKLLQRIKLEKTNEANGNYNSFQHFGYRCDYCDTEPIVGTRWHCTTCPDSIDFCTDCVVSQMYSDNVHPLHHKLLTFHGDLENASSPSVNSELNGISGSVKSEESNSDCSEKFKECDNNTE